MNNFDEVSVKYQIVDRSEVALLISAYQPTKDSANLLRVALDSMLKFKSADSSIWVVDVGSPSSDFKVTPGEYPDVNFIVTDYTPISWTGTSWRRAILNKILLKSPPRAASYANAWTLDFGVHSFSRLDYHPKYLMTLQMDVMFVDDKLIYQMLSLFDNKTAAVGVLKQKNLSKDYDILHSLGCMWNYQIYTDLELSMEIDFPKYDVGERAIVKAVKSGYCIKNFECSYSNPNIIDILPIEYQNLPGVDRTIGIDNKVIFMHLGRGIPKSENLYWKGGKTTVLGWVKWFENNIRRV